MVAQVSPFIESKYGAPAGERGWNSWMDENLLKFSFLFDRNVDAIVSSLPPIVNGEAYFLDSENRLYFAVQGLWYSSPVPKWFEFVIKSTGEVYRFNGNTVSIVESTENFEPRLEAVELTLSQLGSAAYSSVEDFATQSNLDVVSAQANAYTDALAQALADSTGSSMVGYGGTTVESTLDGLIASQVKSFVSPFDFGASGDGVANDTAAVQAAITEAQSLQKSVNLEGGVFSVSNLVSNGVDIYSDREGATLRVRAGATNILTVGGSKSFTWRNFLFDGNSEGTSRAFTISSSGAVYFENISFANWTSRAAFFENSVSSALISGGRVYNNTAPDIFCYKANFGKFTGIHFSDCTEHVIRFGRFGSDPEALSRMNSVIGCTFDNVGNDPVLFELGARQGVVSGNTYRNCRRIVKIETTADGSTQDFVVSNNVFTTQIGVPGEAIKALGVVRVVAEGNHIDGASLGITVGGQSRVSNNYLRSITDYGILYAQSCSVTGNVLDNVGGDGIRAFDSTSTRTTISGNCLTNVTGVGINATGSDCVITGNAIQSTGAVVRLVSTSNYAVVVGNNFRGGTALANSSTGSVVANNVN